MKRPDPFSLHVFLMFRPLTCVLRRYVMRSKAPSGGMKEMVRSFSNRASLTHLRACKGCVQ